MFAIRGLVDLPKIDSNIVLDLLILNQCHNKDDSLLDSFHIQDPCSNHILEDAVMDEVKDTF